MTELNRSTPISAVRQFAIKQGLDLNDELAELADAGRDKRVVLYDILHKGGWPEGLEGFMEARRRSGWSQGGWKLPSSNRTEPRLVPVLADQERAHSAPPVRRLQGDSLASSPLFARATAASTASARFAQSLPVTPSATPPSMVRSGIATPPSFVRPGVGATASGVRSLSRSPNMPIRQADSSPIGSPRLGERALSRSPGSSLSRVAEGAVHGQGNDPHGVGAPFAQTPSRVRRGEPGAGARLTTPFFDQRPVVPSPPNLRAPHTVERMGSPGPAATGESPDAFFHERRWSGDAEWEGRTSPVGRRSPSPYLMPEVTSAADAISFAPVPAPVATPQDPMNTDVGTQKVSPVMVSMSPSSSAERQRRSVTISAPSASPIRTSRRPSHDNRGKVSASALGFLQTADGSAAFGEDRLAAVGEEGSEGRCAGVDHLAVTFGCPPPVASTWLEMLGMVMDRIPHAMLVVDMCVPGLPMVFCNTAMVALTGYSKEQLEGQNCRMLQGPRTEASAVHQIVESIRAVTRVAVRITNYRADGSEFINVLSMVPVRDSMSTCRFSIGVLCDLESGERDAASLDALYVLPCSPSPVLFPSAFPLSPSLGPLVRYHALPTRFDADLQVLPSPSSLRTALLTLPLCPLLILPRYPFFDLLRLPVLQPPTYGQEGQLEAVGPEVQAAQRLQWRPLLTRFTRLLWTADYGAAFRQLLEHPLSVLLFTQWLEQEKPELKAQLELLLLVREMQAHPDRPPSARALELCTGYMGDEDLINADEAVKKVLPTESPLGATECH